LRWSSTLEPGTCSYLMAHTVCSAVSASTSVGQYAGCSSHTRILASAVLMLRKPPPSVSVTHSSIMHSAIGFASSKRASPPPTEGAARVRVCRVQRVCATIGFARHIPLGSHVAKARAQVESTRVKPCGQGARSGRVESSQAMSMSCGQGARSGRVESSQARLLPARRVGWPSWHPTEVK